jgi:hypothetical protein
MQHDHGHDNDGMCFVHDNPPVFLLYLVRQAAFWILGNAAASFPSTAQMCN